MENNKKSSKKRPGRKPLNHSKQYKLGYSAGFHRAERKASGQIPITRKTKDALRSKDWQEGLRKGLIAGKHFYGNGKVNKG